jgi:hypothetical protein
VARIMRELGLEGRRKRRFKATTSATRLTADVRNGLRKMLREVHRVVQKPDELHGARGVDPVEEDVTRRSTALADVERANAWANVVARLAALRVAGTSAMREGVKT